MKPPQPETPDVEQDDRFPSGPWVGYFLQPDIPPGKHLMELILRFSGGTIQGEGRDWVGDFLVRGKYGVEDGKCWWTKTYVKKHSVAYQGYNEGKGIWGTWEYEVNWKGGFYIWPEAMGDPTQSRLSESAEIPTEVPADTPPTAEPVEAPLAPAEVAEPVGLASASRRGVGTAHRP